MRKYSGFQPVVDISNDRFNIQRNMCLCDKSKGITPVRIGIGSGPGFIRLFDARILCHCLKTP